MPIPNAQMPTSDQLIDEQSRIATLRASGLLGSGSEERFDRIVRLAAHVTGASYAMLSLVEESTIEAKSSVGLLATPHSRLGSFCDVVVTSGQPFSIYDALAHPVHRDSPWVLEYPQARFYAGVPMRAPNNDILGSLAILDPRPWAMQPAKLSMLSDLAAMVEAEVALGFSMNERREARALLAEARMKPSIDALTGIWNRAAIDEIVKAELSRSMRGEPTTIAFIGIDSLGAINLGNGRSAGDAAIAAIASCVRHCIRDFDFVGRDQNDVFMLVLSNCDKKSGKNVCDRIRSFIAKQNFTAKTGTPKVTISIGLATSASGPDSRAGVVSAALKCMAIAKAAGRNRSHSDAVIY